MDLILAFSPDHEATPPLFDSSSNEPTPSPIQPEESSIQDPSIRSVTETAQQIVTYRLVEEGTIRRKMKLVSSSGYSYNIKRKLKSGTDWQCTVRRSRNPCRATLKERDGEFFPSATIHNHPSEEGAAIAAKVAAAVKRKAMEDIFRPAADIVEEILVDELDSAPCPALKKPCYMVRCANRLRQSQRPPDPKDLAFELNHDHIPADFMRADLTVGERRHLVMATDSQLKVLKTAKNWYIDGTFKLCRPPFQQLLTVNAFVRSDDYTKQVPLVFVLMSGRRKRDYKRVFQCIIELLRSGDDNGAAVKQITLDYEKALWTALREILPNVRNLGCVFHWTQAVWRKVFAIINDQFLYIYSH